MMRGMLIILVLVLAVCVSVRAHEETNVPANKICPVLPDEPIDSAIYADYEGQRVWFCCARCRKQFLQNPEAYLANLPQFRATSMAGEDQPSIPQETHDHGQHDHATAHGEPQGVNRLIRFLGKFHPVAVHFPIALIVAAALAEAMGLFTRRPFFGHAARFSLALGALSIIITVGFGWAAGTFASYPGPLADVLSIHRWLGTSAGTLVIVTAALSELFHRGKGNRLAVYYRVALFVSVLLVGLAGHFGSTLIYGLEHYTW